MDIDLTQLAPFYGVPPSEVMAIHPSGEYIACRVDIPVVNGPSGTFTNQCGVWNTTTRECVWTTPDIVTSFWSLDLAPIRWSPDGRYLIVLRDAERRWAADTSMQGMLQVCERYEWETRTLDQSHQIRLPDGWLMKMILAPDGLSVACGAANEMWYWTFVTLHSEGSGQIPNSVCTQHLPLLAWQTPTFHPSSQFAIVGFTEWRIHRGGLWRPLERDGYLVGKITIVALKEGYVTDIVIDDAVPVAYWRERKEARTQTFQNPTFLDEDTFTVELPTHEIRQYRLSDYIREHEDQFYPVYTDDSEIG